MLITESEGVGGSPSPAVTMPAGGAATPASSFTAEIPSSPASGSVAVAERPFLDSVPAEFRDKPWVQEFAKNEKPWDALLKSHAGALEVVGKKGVEVPGEGATPETIAAFNKAMGVPDKPEGYAYTPPDISKEPEAVQKALAGMKDDAFINSMRAEALKAGMTPKQFNALAATFDSNRIAQVKANIDAQGVNAQTYKATETKLMKELYGDNSDAVAQNAKEILAKVIPQSIRDSKNANLALVAAAQYISEKVFKNDTIGGANMGAPQASKESIREQITKLRQDPGFRDQFARNHKDINTRIDALYNQLYDSPPKE